MDLFVPSPNTEGMLVIADTWLYRAAHDIAALPHQDCEFGIGAFLAGAEFTPSAANSIALTLAMLLTMGAEETARIITNAHLEAMLKE